MEKQNRTVKQIMPWWLAGLLLLATLVRWAAVLANTPSLLSFIPDDAYYYFVPVRRLLSGGGISFDGLHLTNGFHPLWFGILQPIFAVFYPAERDAPIIAALFIAAILAVLAGYLLWRTIRLITGNALVAALMCIIFLFNPYLVSLSINGLETSVHMLCVLLLVYWTAWLLGRDDMSRRDALVFGAIIGLTFLSRTDSVILIGILGLALWLARFTRQRFTRLLQAGVVAAVFALPWLLWNYAQFGTIMQSSGTSLTDFARNSWFFSEGAANPLPMLIVLTGYYLNMALRWAGFSFLTLVVLGVPVSVAILNRHPRKPRGRLAGVRFSRGELRWLMIALVYVFLYVGFHSIVRWFMREWYFASVLSLFYVGLGVLVALLLRMLQAVLPARGELRIWRRTATGAVLLVILIGGWAQALPDPAFQFWGQPQKYPRQFEMYNGGQWIRENLPADARFGSFNAGILAYYSERTIINLDGVMNYEAQPYIRFNNLLCYVARANLDYLVDFQNVFSAWRPIFSTDSRLRQPELYSPVYVSAAEPPAGESRYTVLKVDKARLRAATSCQP